MQETPPNNILTVTNDCFESVVLKSSQPFLLDFWAPWCGPCKMLNPVLEAVAGSGLGVTIGKINIDDNTQAPVTYGVMSIPTLMLFIDGEVVDSMSGMKSQEEIETWLRGKINKGA